MDTLGPSLAHTNWCGYNNKERQKKPLLSIITSQCTTEMCPSSEHGGTDTERSASLTI